MLAILALTGISTFPLPVLGNTWIVDDDGGPGVDFTTIQAAIDAASANDVLLVRPGTYATSTLTKGLRIVGQGGPVLDGVMRVEDTPAGSLAVVSGLRSTTNGLGYPFTAIRCLGTVVAEDVQCSSVTVTDSLDVRVRGNATPGGNSALYTTRSRVEVVECVFRGENGPQQWCGWPPDPTGRPAASVTDGELHVARSSFRGGDGGDSICNVPIWAEEGGDGGYGIELYGQAAQLLVTGIPSNVLVGGTGGWSTLYGPAPDGRGLRVYTTCSARVSGVTIVNQTTQGTGTITTVVPSDPTLRLLGVPVPGANLTFRLVAPAGASAQLRIGPLPVIVPIGGLEEDVLVARAQTVGSGIVPAGDVLGFNFPIGANWLRGTTVFAQADVTLPGGEVRRTHSIPIVVR